ncbi:MAG: hypothetical protein ACOC9T_03720 [Myxococcota bacterium]
MTTAAAKIGTSWQPVEILRRKGDRIRVRDRDGKERMISARNVRMPEVPPRAPALHRSPSGNRVAPVARPKPPKPTRSRAYLDYVRSHPCCNPRCGAPGPSDPHHYGPRGYGQKTDDHRCVPLCRPCHRAWDAKHALPGLEAGESRELMYRTQVDLLVRWIRGARRAEV